ncbi:MAG: hypothetical protein SOU08_05680 [Anaerococcus sp.]|nr:hypothetical protein [Anaerococcus sp.]MDD7044104.1 hypothetical protein [Peptoniphilaceae bacterium]MDY2919106.1 hypothetical protein [Anaerococcus sp.]
MDKKKLEGLEFLTSLVTAFLLFVLGALQISKGNKFSFLIIIAGILMAANAYVKYKKYKESNI